MLGITAWYELYDAEEFELVEERITEALGYDCWECEEFIAWNREMAEDLQSLVIEVYYKKPLTNTTNYVIINTERNKERGNNNEDFSIHSRAQIH